MRESLLLKQNDSVLFNFIRKLRARINLGYIDQVNRSIQRLAYLFQQAKKRKSPQTAVHQKVYIAPSCGKPPRLRTKQSCLPHAIGAEDR